MFILKVVLTFVHVITCIVLIVAILLQSSKGGGLAGTFGGQATSTLFGPRGAASALASLTRYLAGGFLVLSLIISLMAGAGRSGSAVQDVLNSSPAPTVEDFQMSQPAASGDQAAPPAAQGETK